MKSAKFKTHWLFFAVISLALSWIAYALFYYTDVAQEQNRFQQEFNVLEKKQQQFVKTLSEVVNSSSIEEIWKMKELQNNSYTVQLYHRDSLLFWNNNSLSFQDYLKEDKKHFVEQTLNGFYLIDQFEVHDISIFVGSKLKNEFYYQNGALKNNLTKHFTSKNELKLSLDASDDGFGITSINGDTKLFVEVLKEKTIGRYKELIIFSLYIFGILSLLISLTSLLLPLAKKQKWLILLYPFVLLAFRYFSIQFTWFKAFNNFNLFDPNLFAHSSLIPSLGSLIISLVIVFILVWWTLNFLSLANEKGKWSFVLLISCYLGLLFYSVLISILFESLVVNSSINLVIDEMFSLDIYSFVALFIIACLFFSYYFLIRQLSTKLIHSNIPLTVLALIWFITGVSFFILEIFFFKHNMLHATWPVLINALMFYLATKTNLLNSTKYNILLIIVISFYAAIFLFKNNQSNEHQKRELYANQLITEQDPTMEIEYQNTIEQLVENPYFYQTLDEMDFFSAPHFALQIEDCCFGSFWEQYDIGFFFFNEDETPTLEYISDKIRTKKSLEHIIEEHAIASTIADQLYYVKDYHDQLSYIGKRSIEKTDGEKLDFYILFKSKKIPEKIGFPRLLMNEKSYALQNLEEYSIARYSNNQLVMKFGTYDYPRNMNAFKDKIDTKPTFYTVAGINHLVYKQEDGLGVIISKPEKRFIEQLSTFSYLVLFFGVFAFCGLLIMNFNSFFPLKTLQLSLKIQTVLISMMVGAFAIFVVLSIQNVKRQYNANTLETLREKTASVETIIDQRFGANDELRPEINGDYFNFLLKRLSNVFVADINFYSTDGNLFATSQTKLYEKGISTRLMNSQAYFALKQADKSEFFHREHLGNLTFFSGYLPFLNHDGKLLGFINLQHFSKQNTFQNQMNEFIVSFINVTVLLLVISVLLAILISGWITAPLRLIQQSFAKVEFGKENKPILYSGDDEIGSLVKEYNHKLEELELKAMELARSERESAWREMAKQVAHEIKNPLTPMKLSVQHFQRSFDPSDPRSKEKMQRLFASLIEQIDALTNIANEFSNFAKMPKANEEELDLVPVLYKIIELYQNDEVKIHLSLEKLEQVSLFADKDLLIRVFNNLIKNAIQATEEGEFTEIEIAIKEEVNQYLIAIKDNGSGIPDELKDKMFVPNFTTKSTGSGLGLAMTRQIITSLHGNIWFESEQGKGTTFYIELPKRMEE